MALTGVDSIRKMYDIDKLLDGDDAFARLYGSFEEQSEIARKKGPRETPNRCWIKRNKKTSTFYLYLAPTPSFSDKGKFLLAARRFRTAAYTYYIISLDAEDFSQGSNAYVGKLRSDFLRSSFTVYDSQPPHNGAKPSDGRRFASKQISPQVPAENFEVGQVTYKHKLFKSEGPRRMVSTLRCTPSSSPDDTKMMQNSNEDGSCFMKLENKAPRWHEDLQCWCLNFRGRVTVASIKNFQLVATTNQSQPSGEETVLLQFGKVGDDSFTMDYIHTFSAFQAFAISLTSFGPKLGWW